jgi:hypothetical protein
MKIRQLMIGSSLLISLFFISPGAGAQQFGEALGVPTRLTVTVEPKKGNEIPTIMKDDLVVTQGHDRRSVLSWEPATGQRAGLALAILIDDGSGFSLGAQLNDVRSFITQQAPTTLVAVGYMQNGTVSMVQNFTNDHAAAAKSVRLPMGYFGAQASPYLSLSDFIKRWQTSPQIPRREVLMITSGEDTVYMGLYPNPYAETALRDAQCAGVVVYSIYTPAAGHFGHSYWRSYWGQNYLSQISDESGGESFYLLGSQAPVSFAPYLKKMDSELGAQFLMEFSAMPQKKAGLEPVKITSEIHAVDFLHSDRVCVPASAQ